MTLFFRETVRPPRAERVDSGRMEQKKSATDRRRVSDKGVAVYRLACHFVKRSWKSYE